MPPPRIGDGQGKRMLKTVEPASTLSAVERLAAPPAVRSWSDILRQLPRPTQEGIIWMVLATFLMFLRAFNLVTLIASFMFGAALINWLALLMRSRLGQLVVRRSHDGPVFADQPCLVGIEVTNPTQWTQVGLGFRDEGSRHEHVWGIPILWAGESRTSWFQLSLPRRGVYRWFKLELTCRYPFGLFRRRVRLDQPHEVIVLPSLGELHRGRLRQLMNPPPRPTPQPRRRLSRRSLAPADFYGVRDFRPGDSPRWIHWRTTARMGTPMVREFEETPLEHLLVVVDPWLPDSGRLLRERCRDLEEVRQQEKESVEKLGERGAAMRRRREGGDEALTSVQAPLENLERALSLAATLCWTWHQQVGTDLALAVVDEKGASVEFTGGVRGVIPLLETLARVEGGRNLDIDDLVDRLTESWLPQGAIVVVSTRSSPLADLLGAALRRSAALLDVSDPISHEYFRTSARAWVD
ncbi:MAG TPA: DUF58 domain-containing protein [Gemmatales bacterium]|nr:DUF58 domain-containing protein [Gemmatales bacterium]